jgi:hypothetical protein
LGFFGVLGGELFQGLIEGDQVIDIVKSRRDGRNILQFDAFDVAALLRLRA